ncbi:MAG: helix-turn-helix transcriptional regulator [Pseudomonadota bacterium]
MTISIDSFAKFRELYGIVEEGKIEEVGESISQNVTAYRAEPLVNPEDKVRAQSAAVTSQDVSLVYLDWNLPSVGVSLTREEDFNLRVTLEGEVSTTDPFLGHISAEREKGQARIFSLAEDTRTYSQGHTALNLVIPMKVLENRAKSYFSDQLDKSLRFAPTLNLSTPQGHSILHLIEYFKGLHTETPECFENPVVATQFQELMFANLIGGLEHNYSGAFDDGARDVAIPRTIKKAEDYMRAHAGEPITIEQLALEACCSERALQNGFRQFRNKSPLAVLRDIRLECAFDDLVRTEASVTEIAMKWGFSNLGRFSKYFEEKYGMKPSVTRRFDTSGTLIAA